MTRSMRFAGIAMASLAAACAPAGPAAAPGPLPQLAGRIAGPVQNCVHHDNSMSVHLDGEALLFGSGRTVWVNTNRCPGVTDNDLPIFEPFGSQYCRGDIMRTVDRLTHIPGPSCVLGDFTPYVRPPR